MNATAVPAIEVRDLTLRFGGLVALRDLSLTVAPGTIHAVIGPNGAGKSTLFNCISRLYQPQSGSILVHGRDIGDLHASAIAGLGVARTFQNLELFGGLSVFENMLIGAHIHCRGNARAVLSARPRGIADQIEAILTRVGLIDFRHSLASSLDFGRQKLLELARALALRPTLLLLDEPAAGLRNRAVEVLDRTLTELSHQDGMTIVLVEHVMQLVMAISDRVTVLNFGSKIAEGPPAAVRSDAAVIEAYLGREEAIG